MTETPGVIPINDEYESYYSLVIYIISKPSFGNLFASSVGTFFLTMLHPTAMELDARPSRFHEDSSQGRKEWDNVKTYI